MTETLLKKLTNLIKPNPKDFSFYILKLKKIAPLTAQYIGEEKLKNIFTQYFQELVMNTETPEENIFYLPIFLKKHTRKFKLTIFCVELCDFEFSSYQTKNDSSTYQNGRYNDLNVEVFYNPTAQALRLTYDILGYVEALSNPKKDEEIKPEKIKNLLFISKNLDTKELIYLRGNYFHAAIIDELHDGKMAKKDLIQAVQTKHPKIPQRDWIVALKDLKSNFIIIEK